MHDFDMIGHYLSSYLRARNVGCTNWGDGVISITWDEPTDLRVVLAQALDGSTVANIGAIGEIEPGAWIDVDFVLDIPTDDFALIYREVCQILIGFIAE